MATTTFLGPVVSTNGFVGDVNGSALTTPAGTGITGGTGTVYTSNVSRQGNIVTTQIYIDLTGLNSKNTDGDIIGVDGTSNACHLGQITTAESGALFHGQVTVIETPAGGDPNIMIYAADEATGVEDGAVGDLTEHALYDPNGDLAAAIAPIALTDLPDANEYIYLAQGDATGTDDTYTAGILLIELKGYAAPGTNSDWS